jgi:hypothetical protein
MDALVKKFEDDADAGIPGALYALGVTWEAGVEREPPDLRQAYLCYRDAGTPEALARCNMICTLVPGVCN